MKRLLLTAALALLPLPAPAQSSLVNVLQTDAGASVSASSRYSDAYHESKSMNGDTTGREWGGARATGGGWNSGGAERFGVSTLTFSLSRGYNLASVEVVGLRSDFGQSPTREPTDTETTIYPNRDYDVEVSADGAAFETVAQVRGNSRVKTSHAVDSAKLTRYVRVRFLASPDGYARLVELRLLARV